MYRGCEVAVQHEYIYLGVRLHDTRGLAGASDALAASGSKAMHAVLTRCRRADLTQFDIKTRMFDALVEPVVSYASHIWGPLIFAKKLHSGPFNTQAEKVHSSFLRVMTGAGRSVSLDVLYRDLHRLPVMFHWVALAVRWWNRMSASRDSGDLAPCAWREDVALAMAGCRDCWAYFVLHTMSALQLLEADWRLRDLDWVLQRQWEEPDVTRALTALFKARWQPHLSADPRSAPSLGVAKCTHHAWVYPFDPDIAGFTRANAPAHTKLCASFAALRNLAQLRIGCAHLEVEEGRKRQIPRPDRLCRLCSSEDATLAHRGAILARTGTSQNVEDLKHFVLECPAYDALRSHCPAFPPDLYSRLADLGLLVSVFEHENQSSLARTLLKMKVHRADLLGLPLI